MNFLTFCVQIEEISGALRESTDKRELCLTIIFTDRMQRGLKTEFKDGM